MKGETTRLTFSNIQLHQSDRRLQSPGECTSGSDVLTIYEGEEKDSNVLDKFCGFHNNQIIESKASVLLVVFQSDSRLEEQGFAATYQFFGKATTKNIIRETNNSNDNSRAGLSTPARCGSIINSLDQKNGTIESPGYPRPYPAELTCRFTFQGVGQERVQLRFVHMDLHFPSGDPADPVDCTDSDSVTVYIHIDNKETKLDTFCGEKLPPMLMSSGQSSGPAMIVEFRSFRGSDSVTGFRANFEFVTNYGITSGRQDTRRTCVFNYQSHQQREGHIMSPNYPGLYPRNTECHYLFYGQEKERVHITFLFFEVDGIPPRCDKSTNSDYVSFSNFHETDDRKMARKCGQSNVNQQQIKSDGAYFRVTFKSNHVYDGHGFQAFYQFSGGSPPDSRQDSRDLDKQRSLDSPDHNGGVSHESNAATSTTVAVSPSVMLLLYLCVLLSYFSPSIFLPNQHRRFCETVQLQCQDGQLRSGCVLHTSSSPCIVKRCRGGVVNVS